MSDKKCERCCGPLIKRYFESKVVFQKRKFCSKLCSNLSNPSSFKIGDRIRFGSRHTEESKNKLSSSQKERYKKLKENGLKHARWKGGYENKLWHNRMRRVKKLQNGGCHSLKDWLKMKEECNYTCLHCLRSEPEITLSQDHIIPLSKGGSDDITNIQPLCRSCNSKKKNK